MPNPSPNLSRPLTVRQHLKALLNEQNYTARELASRVGIAEKLVEDHLLHVIRSLGQQVDQQFVMEMPTCHDCGFRFRERTRLKRPSRCPKCRSEDISSPRFSIHQVSGDRTTRNKWTKQ